MDDPINPLVLRVTIEAAAASRGAQTNWVEVAEAAIAEVRKYLLEQIGDDDEVRPFIESLLL